MSDKKMEIKQTAPIQPQLSDKAFKHMYSWEELRQRTKKSDWLYKQITEMMKRGEKGKEISELVEKLRESIEYLAAYYKTRYLIKLGYIENELKVEATNEGYHDTNSVSVDVAEYDADNDIQLTAKSSMIDIEEALVDVMGDSVPANFYADIKEALKSGKILRIEVSPGFGAEVYTNDEKYNPIVLPSDSTILTSLFHPEHSANESVVTKMQKFKKK